MKYGYDTMLKVKKEGIILRPTKLEFENDGVLNPACIRVENNVHMFYRAVKKGNISTIGYCKLEGPLKVAERLKIPFMSHEFSYESKGLEDPRIVEIDGTYYMTYIGYDGKAVRIVYATSKDLKKFEKKSVSIIGKSYQVLVSVSIN